MAARTRCPVCGSTDVQVDSPTEHRYEHCGLEGVVLMGRGSARITHCSSCEHVTTVIRDEQQLLQVLGLGLIRRPAGMTGQELRYLRRLFELTQAELAAELALPRRETIADWERKPRIFAAPRDEIVLRLLLIHLFRTRVVESDPCFLAAPHLEGFEEFEATFVERASEMLRSGKQRPKSTRVGIRHQARKKQWSADLVTV